MQEILLRMLLVVASGTAVGMIDHTDPFQCSMRTPEAMPVLSVVDPDAQQSLASTQVRPLR
jgi:hypothetical protein